MTLRLLTLPFDPAVGLPAVGAGQYSRKMQIVNSPPHFVVVVDPDGLPPGSNALLASSSFGVFEIRISMSPEDVSAQIESGCDALILRGDSAAWQFLAEAGSDVAVLVVVDKFEPAETIDWFQRGAEDVLHHDELAAPMLVRRLRAAIERKRQELEARTAYATDLDTGLPHQRQLTEHLSQLLALREREPAPMAVLAFRIEGLAHAEARHGRELAQSLRRKIGVRLRAGVRASDVVGSLGDDTFAVLLGSILTPDDAPMVANKLLEAVTRPFRLAGAEFTIGAALGISSFPEDGSQPEVLLRRAIGLAAGGTVRLRAGSSMSSDVGAERPGAANDS